MIEKKYLYENKNPNYYVRVCVEKPKGLGLTDVYESLFSILDPQINPNEVFIVDYREIESGVFEVMLDVEDIDFSEFED